MSIQEYISCPYCNKFFTVSVPASPDKSQLLKCPYCKQLFGVKEGPPVNWDQSMNKVTKSLLDSEASHTSKISELIDIDVNLESGNHISI